MNLPIENLEAIEAEFLLNKQDNNVISELLNRLSSYENLPEYAPHGSLMSSLKICLSKQQLENNNFVTDK